MKDGAAIGDRSGDREKKTEHGWNRWVRSSRILVMLVTETKYRMVTVQGWNSTTS